MVRHVLAAGLAALAAAIVAVPALANGTLGTAAATPAGMYGGIAYVEYNGIFSGRTSTGTYRVPYRITAPANPSRGNRTVLVEPPHYAEGLNGLDLHFGRAFLFGRGFVHSGVGYSTANFDGFDKRILDPSVPGTFVNGGFAEDVGGRTDYEIVADFGRALATGNNARAMLGRVDRRYVLGFSDSSAPVLGLLLSGQANRVFDLALPFTTGPVPFDFPSPQTALAQRVFTAVVIVNSEGDGPTSVLVDNGSASGAYRFYAVAGASHVADPFVPFFSNGWSPATWYPEFRAHFLQADAWVVRGTAPPASTHLLSSDGETFMHDANGNAIAVDTSGRLVPASRSSSRGGALLPRLRGRHRILRHLRQRQDDRSTSPRPALQLPQRVRREAHGLPARGLHPFGRRRRDAQASRALPASDLHAVSRDHYEDFIAMRPC